MEKMEKAVIAGIIFFPEFNACIVQDNDRNKIIIPCHDSTETIIKNMFQGYDHE